MMKTAHIVQMPNDRSVSVRDLSLHWEHEQRDVLSFFGCMAISPAKNNDLLRRSPVQTYYKGFIEDFQGSFPWVAYRVLCPGIALVRIWSCVLRQAARAIRHTQYDTGLACRLGFGD
ncbi:MAG: hypothetical protein ACYS74_12920 [Planctomycetota bacterium]